jgi:HPt (histidine-containing phosphotransfer) domain-containing protein
MKIDDINNRKELAERLDHDMVFFRELAALFSEDSPKLIDNIRIALDDKDPDRLRKYAHTLKGSVSNFSAPAAFEAAYALEMMGRNRDLSRAEEAFSLMMEKINEAREAMSLLMKEESL